MGFSAVVEIEQGWGVVVNAARAAIGGVDLAVDPPQPVEAITADKGFVGADKLLVNQQQS